MQPLNNALKPLRRRIILQKCLDFALLGLIGGCSVGLFLLILGKFILLEQIVTLVGLSIIVSMLVGIISAVILRPNPYFVAKTGDSLGYKERFITALELSNRSNLDMFAALEIDDAINHAKKANFKNYKIRPPKKWLIIVLMLSLSMIVAGYTKSPFEDKLLEQIQVKEAANKEIELLEKQAEEILNELPKSKTEEVSAILKELFDKLKQARTQGELIRELQDIQTELKRISKDSISKDLKELGEKLSQNEMTKKLGDSLQKGDMQAITEQMKEFSQFLETATAEELELLSEHYEQLAKELENNAELSTSLDEASKKLANGEDTSNEMSNIAKQLEKLASENQDLRNAINKLNDSIAKSATRQSQQSQSQSSQQTQSSSSNQQSQNQQNGQQSQSQQSGQQSQNQQNGQQSNPGQQTNQTGQQSGTGIGQQQGEQASTNQQPGQGRGFGHISNEEIYSRKAENYADTEFDINVERNESGTSTEQEIQREGNRAGIVSANQVINEYRNEALDTLDETQIPAGMKNLVKEYFSKFN